MALFRARTSGFDSKSIGCAGGGAAPTWSDWVVCVKVGRPSAKSGIALCAVAGDEDAPEPVWAAPGSCAGLSIGVRGLTGGRDGDDGGDVRDVVEARRGFEGGCGAVPDAGRASVAMVRPGMVAVMWCRIWCRIWCGMLARSCRRVPAVLLSKEVGVCAGHLGVGVTWMGVNGIPVDAAVHPTLPGYSPTVSRLCSRGPELTSRFRKSNSMSEFGTLKRT